MEVILLERIEKLGQMGDVVKVKSGYARNYLLPKKKALRATEENKRQFEGQREQFETKNLESRTEAEALSKKIDGLTVILIRQAGEGGQLYGSVNARDIAAAVTEAGVSITRQQVALAHPIKALGLHEVRVNVHPEIGVQVVVNVSRSKDEAKIQAKTGKAGVSGEEKASEAPQTPVAVALEEDTPGDAKKPKVKKAKVKAIEDEETKTAEEAANEAVADQSDQIFEEGAAPKIEPLDGDADESEAGKEDANTADSEDTGKESADKSK